MEWLTRKLWVKKGADEDVNAVTLNAQSQQQPVVQSVSVLVPECPIEIIKFKPLLYQFTKQYKTEDVIDSIKYRNEY